MHDGLQPQHDANGQDLPFMIASVPCDICLWCQKERQGGAGRHPNFWLAARIYWPRLVGTSLGWFAWDWCAHWPSALHQSTHFKTRQCGQGLTECLVHPLVDTSNLVILLLYVLCWSLLKQVTCDAGTTMVRSFSR